MTEVVDEQRFHTYVYQPDDGPERSVVFQIYDNSTLVDEVAARDGNIMPAVQERALVAQDDAAPEKKEPGWFQQHRRTIALGALAVAAVGAEVALTHISGVSPDDIVSKVERNAPWMLAGLAVSEGLWIGGAVIAALGAGVEVGNPLTIRQRWDEIRSTVAYNPVYRFGMYMNGLGALGTAGILAVATGTTLPPEAWPIPAAVIASDVAQTVATRRFLLPGTAHTTAGKREFRKERDVTIRRATLDDIYSLADLDLRLFEGAYGEEPPTHGEVVSMFTRRFVNNPDGMFVAVVNGEIKGFVTAFLTNKPIEDFKSWEDSTANGTLDGRVDPHGKYLYVTNLTMDTHGTGNALDSLLASAFAMGIEHGVEYGYFCSRMPGFRRWATARAEELGVEVPNGEELDIWANEYTHLTRTVKSKRGVQVRPLDRQLSFYTGLGLELTHAVPNAFEDYDSMNYQVPVKAHVPGFAAWSRHIKPARIAIAAGLREVARHPKVLAKVL